MAGPARAVMADWLALHGLQAADCLHLLPRLDGSAAPLRAPDPELGDRAPLPMVVDALKLTLPPAAEILARIGAEVRVDLAPDPQRFPRAFTLHDDGRGLPFICCPLKGRNSDLLVLAHELGHACQILASGRPDLPPIQRETAAYLAEVLVTEAIGRTEPERGAILSALHRAGTDRIMRREGRPLARALADPTTPYAYGWNYPIARELAGRAMRHLGPEARWGIFTGTVGLPQLQALPEP
jgi:hypothetical protein